MKVKTLILLTVFSLSLWSQQTAADSALAAELIAMTDVDQFAAMHAFPPDGFEHLNQEQWNKYKDSIYQKHQARLEEILNERGFPSYSMVGMKASQY